MPHSSPDLRELLWPRRHALRGAAAYVVVFGLLAATVAWAQLPREGGYASSFQTDFGEGRHAASGMRFREGTKLVDRLGHFRVQGDQVTFVAGEGEHRFIGLPNLNLERVARAITDEASQFEWSVTGTVTEYRGGNYLLVERAVLKAKTTRPAP